MGSPYSQAMAIIFAGTLLSGCTDSGSPIKKAAGNRPAPTEVTVGPPVGFRADSLNGLQGHIFGEPVRNFPGRVFESQDDKTGESVYWMSVRERGWLGQDGKAIIVYYLFQDGKFAEFRAATTSLGLRAETRRLFGPGKEWKDILRTVNWEGERVRASYSEKLEPPVMSWLKVSSKPLLAVREAKQRARIQAESALDRL